MERELFFLENGTVWIEENKDNAASSYKTVKSFDELHIILIKTPILQHSTLRFLKYMESTGFVQMKNQ